MGARNLDAYSLDDWRFTCPYVAAMVRRRWRLQTVRLQGGGLII